MERKAWTPEEVDLLTRRSASSPLKDLAAELDRPIKMVRWKAKKLGLEIYDARQDNPGRAVTVWTEERLDYLREHAPTTDARNLAEHFGVSERSVRSALDDHGIKGRGVSRTQDPEHVEKRIAPLRGVIKVDREALRECSSCHEMKPPHQYPSETTIETTLCEACRKAKRAEEWANTSPEEKIRVNLRQRVNKHGLTHEVWVQMLEEQDYSCLLCGVPFDETVRPQIDHDHAHCPGRWGCEACVRGLLCQPCNMAVGWYEKILQDEDYLTRIENYLKR